MQDSDNRIIELETSLNKLYSAAVAYDLTVSEVMPRELLTSNRLAKLHLELSSAVNLASNTL